MVRHAGQAGYRAGKTLYGLPYDWRLAPSENKICPDLAQLVTHVTNTTAHRKVESLCSCFYRDGTDTTGMTRAMPTPGIAAQPRTLHPCRWCSRRTRSATCSCSTASSASSAPRSSRASR